MIIALLNLAIECTKHYTICIEYIRITLYKHRWCIIYIIQHNFQMELVENSGKYKINAITDCSNTDLTLLQCSQVKICSHMQEVLDTLDNGLYTSADEWYNKTQLSS